MGEKCEMKKSSAFKAERELRGWSQAKIAEELHVSKRTVSRWEQGLAIPYPYYVQQLRTLFGKSAYELGLVAESDDEGEREEESAPLPTPVLFDAMIPEAPGSANNLLGRTMLLTQIKQRLLDHSSVALTALNGLPGIGKTALATAIATDKQVQAHYSDGILWTGLGPQPNVLSVLVRWGNLLGIRAADVEDASSQKSWWRALHATIGSRRMLLVIDDAWSAEDAMALKIGGSNCAHLLTTRSPQVAFLFAQQQAIVVPELEEKDGLVLLARFVPQFVEQDDEEARELIRMVAGLPLAVKLIGYYLAFQMLSGQPRRLKWAITRLHDTQQLLEVNMPAKWQERSPTLAMSAPQSLRAVIQISDEHLSKQAHDMLCALAVFPAKPNSFSEEAALAISQQPVEALDELWDIGLLESSGPERYTLHQTIVDYASRQDSDDGVKRRLAAYTAQYLQVHEQDYKSIEGEFDNLRAGLNAAVELGMYDELFTGITCFAAYMHARSLYALVDYYLRVVLRCLEDPQKYVIILKQLADVCNAREEYDEAEGYCQQGLDLARRLGQKGITSALLTTQGDIALHSGEREQAQICFEEGLQIARDLGDTKQIATLLCNLSRIAIFHVDYTRAEALLLEGLTLARREGYQESMISLLNYLGEAVRGIGDYERAERYTLESLSLARQLQHHAYLCMLLSSLGAGSWSLGRFEQAETYFLEALAIARQIEHREYICHTLTSLGTISTYPFQNKYAQAEQYLREGIELARQIKYTVQLPLMYESLGVTVGVQGDYAQANNYMQQGIEIAREQNNLWYLVAGLTYWGVLHLKYQQIDAAVSAFEEVLSIDRQKKQDQQLVAEARYGLATVAALRGDLQEAYRLGEESLLTFEATKHYMAGEVRQWLQGLAEKESGVGASGPNKRIVEEDEHAQSQE